MRKNISLVCGESGLGLFESSWSVNMGQDSESVKLVQQSEALKNGCTTSRVWRASVCQIELRMEAPEGVKAGQIAQ